jgi:hypothetical protein
MTLTPELRRTWAINRMLMAYRQIQKAKAADHGKWKGTQKRTRLALRLIDWRIAFWEGWWALPESRYCRNPFKFTKQVMAERPEPKYMPNQSHFLQEVPA